MSNWWLSWQQCQTGDWADSNVKLVTELTAMSNWWLSWQQCQTGDWADSSVKLVTELTAVSNWWLSWQQCQNGVWQRNAVSWSLLTFQTDNLRAEFRAVQFLTQNPAGTKIHPKHWGKYHRRCSEKKRCHLRFFPLTDVALCGREDWPMTILPSVASVLLLLLPCGEQLHLPGPGRWEFSCFISSLSARMWYVDILSVLWRSGWNNKTAAEPPVHVILNCLKLDLFFFAYSLFHPCVTAVARERLRSFYQKCRWQVTSKHAYTLDQTKSEWVDYTAVQA